ncbi:MAG: hypothetical protein WA081_08290 [Desulfosalsimonadaceae bacterium]
MEINKWAEKVWKFDVVDESSNEYLVGEITAALMPSIGRIGYVYRVSQVPKLAKMARINTQMAARTAVWMRNNIKMIYRGPLKPLLKNWHVSSYTDLRRKGKSVIAILERSGITNKWWTSGIIGSGLIRSFKAILEREECL